MSKLLIKLNTVPADEANEIRSLLSDNQINYYETQSGTFGIGIAAIWLQDESDTEQAQLLLKNYAAERQASMQKAYQDALANNEQETFLKKLIREPIKIIAYCVVIGFVIYISIHPFIQMAMDE